MTSPRDLDLGRREGVFIPIDDVEAHAACGWRLVDDLAGRRGLGAGDVVLMQPPTIEQGTA